MRNVRCWLWGHQRYPGAIRYELSYWHSHERCARCNRLEPWGFGPWVGALDRLWGGRAAGNDPNAREGGYGEGRPPR